MDYIEWNYSIAKHFFNETKVSREVFLYVNDELINSLGRKSKCGVDDFIESIKSGPDWIDGVDICGDAIQTFKEWRKKKYEYPPYIAYLAFFVLAAVTETDFASHSYYPGLWKRMGIDQNLGAPANFYKMQDLWHDLEIWSREDKKEELGRFVVRIRGGYSHVGIPWSQTLLSERECRYLPNFFDRVELDPTDAPSPEVLCKLLRINGGDILSTRTQKLFYNMEINRELREALTQYVLDELEDWDGTILFQIQEKESSSKSRVQTGLRICLILDSAAKTVKSYLRFKTLRMFPEDGLNFSFKDNDRIWSCNEEYGGWSHPLRCFDINPPLRLNASLLNWLNGQQLNDEENQWRARMRGSSTRIFRLRLDGLPHWVETQRLERGIEFLVACHGEDIEKVTNWGIGSCDIFEEKDFVGLPPEWKLFYGKNAKESCPDIDVLIISATTRLTLIGGIKADRALHFFNFAPPKILLENSTGNETVKLNGKTLTKKENTPIWSLPKDVPIEYPLRIEAETQGQYQRRTIWLVNFNMPSFFKAPYRNKNGEIITDNSSSDFVCGAIVKSDDKKVKYPNLLPVYLSDRIIFIGEKPGEIVDWPQETLPKDWHPVWALEKKSRSNWKVHFCGSQDQININLCYKKSDYKREDLKKWREVIWVNRRIIKSPNLPLLKTYWKKYEEAAKNCLRN